MSNDAKVHKQSNADNENGKNQPISNNRKASERE